MLSLSSLTDALQIKDGIAHTGGANSYRRHGKNSYKGKSGDNECATLCNECTISALLGA